jgi:NAD-dependent deacetylase
MPRFEIEKAFSISESCEVMLVVGTSAVVQPAASLPIITKRAGAKLIEINIDDTPLTQIADVSLKGKSGEILSLVWEKIRSNFL